MSTPGAVARTGRHDDEIVVDPRSRGDVRVSTAAHLLVFAAVATAAVVASVIVLVQSRFLTFYGDEWNFLIVRPALLEPNNEHWTSGLYAIYYAILGTVGGRSYLPFVLALLVVHWVAAAGLYSLLQAHVGPRVAGLASIALLLLGAAREDFYWAWQIGFVGATAFGLWGLAALDRRRARLAAAMLVGGLTMSGVGLFFLGASAVFALAARRDLRWVAIPVAVYAVWYVGFGASAVTTLGQPFDIATLLSLPEFIVKGVGHALAGVAGFASVPGWPVVSIAVGVALAAALRWTDPLVLAAAAGVVGEYALIGLVRIGTFEGDLWRISRYVYPAGALILVLAALASRRFQGRVPQVAIGAIAAVAIALNTLTLTHGARWYRYETAQAYGCLPATIPGELAGGRPSGMQTVPAELRC